MSSGWARRRALVIGLALCLALLPAEQASAQPADYRMTSFDPEKHGFLFSNFWTKDLGVRLPIVGRVNFGTLRFGLCGGMTYAALDTFRAKATTPRDTSEPAPGTPLRAYAWRRQIDSLTADGAFALRRFLKWQNWPDKDKKIFGWGISGVRSKSRKQFWNRIRPRLKDGRPVPLGLVKVKGPFKAPWHNHQVLAIGYRVKQRTKDISIAVYDPNYPVSHRNPDGITYLHTKSRGQTYDGQGTEVVRRSNGDKVTFRGFFVTPYDSRKPPWAGP